MNGTHSDNPDIRSASRAAALEQVRAATEATAFSH